MSNAETFRCRECGHEFRAPPGPADCPECPSLYVDWLTYDDHFGPGSEAGDRILRVVSAGRQV